MVVDEEQRVLLQQRSAEQWLWTPLSGILEPGEDPAAAVVREVAEETGVRVVVERLVAVTSSPQVRHSNGHVAQYLEIVFACYPAEVGQSPIVGDDESYQVAWWPLDALPPMTERMRDLIALVGKNEPAWFAPAP